MQKITPHLWFDTQAVEATAFYASLFPNSRIKHVNQITDTPSGNCDIVSFELCGQEFQAISAGPYFKFTPAISLMVNFDPSQDADAATNIEKVWKKLSEGGKVLMEFGEYPFSKKYGWCEDKYGLSWQLILTNPAGEPRPAIMPSMLFTGAVAGKAEEASDFYLSIFKDSARGAMARYGANQAPDKEGSIMFTDFRLANEWFVAMDSAHEHKFAFNGSISFMVNCDTQEEIDYYWEKLSAIPEAEQCGWLADKFGVSWQIVPSALDKFMSSGDAEATARVTQAFLKMKKFDIKKLEEAYKG